MTTAELLSQLEKYPRKKVPILTRYLYSRLKKKEIEPDDVCFTAKHLAEHYGISEVTAHKVLEELSRSDQGEHFSPKANLPSQKRKYHLGICIDSLMPREQHYTYLEFPFLIERDNAVRRLETMGHKVTVFTSEELSRPETDLSKLDGLLTKSPPFGRVEESLFRKKLPVVLVQVGVFEPSRFHSIAPDLSIGAMALLDLWPDDRPIIMTTSRNRVAIERFESVLYWAEALHRDLDLFQMNVVPMLPGDLGQLAGYKAGLEIVRTKKNPRILSGSDYFSFGLVNAFQEAHWLPRKDYELISIDNLEGVGQTPFGKPFLTAIDIRLPDLFTAAADLLVEILEKPPVNDCLITHRLPSRFVRRETA